MRGLWKRILPAAACVLCLCQGALAYSTLEKGSSGAEVAGMQQALNTLGYALGADGVYGTQTVNAVKAFQADHSLKVDGKAGNQTLTLLYALAAQGTAPAASGGSAAATPVSPVSTQTTATVYCSDGGKLNLRAGAGTGYRSITRIPNGTALTVLEQGGKWSRVSYNGQTGYVMNAFLRFGQAAAQPTAVPAATAPPASAAGAQAVVVCDDGGKLNLRRTPSSGSKVLERIPNGTALSVYSVDGRWYSTAYNGQTGYVLGSFLSFGAAASANAPTAAPASPVTSVTVNELQYEEFRYAVVSTASGSLNVRKGPGTTYGRVSEIKTGAQIVISSIEGDWCAMYYGDIQGYVQRQYLQIQPASGGQAQAAPSASAYDTSILTRVLRAGDTGADVQLTQQRLRDLGYLSAVSGSYDSATQSAVRTFQKRNSLTADGLAGPSTLSQLFSDGTLAYGSEQSGSYNSYVIDYNGNTSSAKTSAVRKAQQALRALNYNVPLTGAFENRTHDAIVAFQLRNGVTASGVLDAATQTALYSGSAHDVTWPSRYYLPAYAGRGVSAPASVQLLHWYNDVKNALSGCKTVTAYEPASGLSWTLRILSRGHHLDVEPAALEDTLIQKKAFGGTSWEVHPVYILLPDGRWSLATMHDYPHGANTIMNNGFGGQNCVHFLRDMSEAQANDPKYGVQNQEALRSAWYAMTGVQVGN